MSANGPEDEHRPQLQVPISDLLMQYGLIHANITFADQKALALSAINVALIAGLYDLESVLNVPMPGNWERTGLALCFILAVATALSMFIVYPRGREAPGGRGIVDPYRIIRHERPEDFVQDMLTASSADYAYQVVEMIGHRARVNDRKYQLLRWGVAISGFGWLSALGFAAYAKLHF